MLELKDLSSIAHNYKDVLETQVSRVDLTANLGIPLDDPALMGVINLSPDSWYRESICLSVDSAVQRGRVLFEQGASIVDIGAESTVEQAQRVSGEEQQERLLPVIHQLSAAGIVVSTETYNVKVAEACLEAGAKVLNITGTVQNEEMYHLAAEHGATVIICYVAGKNVRDVKEIPIDEDPIPRMSSFFEREIDRANSCGLTKGFIDPGLGFYYDNLKDSSIRIRYQMKTFLNAFRLRKLGWPVCNALPHAFECFGEEVRSAEPFFSVLASLGKTDLIRTHEVSKVAAILKAMRVY
ncbi:MAG: dihydropteroate synthase [Verrucomicrobiales bacterium]|nr:dihydropteroate synthase [Verrucomicrobiales bacterium]|tara:strand:- start:193 stop:1080 length:888 start_codon:yes stop_codon:yes gene_type:complete